MGYLDGFRVTFRQMGKQQPASRAVYPKDEGGKRDKPERLHGRHVLNRYEDGMEKCIGCELCAGVCPARCIYVRGADNPPDDPVSPGRALRLRLRDQLPALHPLRPLRRGLPDRGHHRDEAVRVLVHQPRRRHLHQGRAARRRRRPAPAAAVGGLATPGDGPHTRPGCGPPRRRGDADYEGRVGWSGELGYGVRAAGAGPDAAADSRRDDRRRRPTHDDHDERTEAATDGGRRLRRLRGHRARSARSAWSLSRNPVHSALMPGGTLFGIAVLFVAQDAHFLAAVQVIVYAGAIVVLFLFVIMLLGVDRAEDLDDRAARRPAPARRRRRRRCSAPCSWSSLLGGHARRHRRAVGRGAALDGDVPNIEQLGQAAVHRLPVRLRDHLGAARDRRGRRRRAGPPSRGDRSTTSRARRGRTTRTSTTSTRDRADAVATDVVPGPRRACCSPSAPSGCSSGATRW